MRENRNNFFLDWPAPKEAYLLVNTIHSLNMASVHSHYSTPSNYSRTQAAPGVRKCFRHVPMDNSVNGKIGTLIRKLPDIRAAAGNGAFASFKGAEDVQNLSAWLAQNTHLGTVKSMGVGWYIWAYTTDAVANVGAALLAEEQKFINERARHEAERQRNLADIARRKIEAAAERQLLIEAAAERRFLIEQAKAQEAAAQREAAKANAFPALGSVVTKQPVIGCWVKGKPVAKEAVSATTILLEEAPKRVERAVPLPPRMTSRLTKLIAEDLEEVDYDDEISHVDESDDASTAEDELHETPDNWDDEF